MFHLRGGSGIEDERGILFERFIYRVEIVLERCRVDGGRKLF